MGMPSGIGIIDTMIGFPHRDTKDTYAFITRQTKDRESKEEFAFPAEYMFKNVPEKQLRETDDPIALTLEQMDRWGVERGLIGVGDAGGTGELAIKRYPDRFIPSTGFDPMPAWTPYGSWCTSTRRWACERWACFRPGRSRRSRSSGSDLGELAYRT